MNKILMTLLVFLYFIPFSYCFENDFISDEFLSEKIIEKPAANVNYDYQDTNYIPNKNFNYKAN